ncbi:hypothetical protein E2C01_004593 [Portunus trituberculatus]|uniref:Uncharacterized protein n=1 Tax=Portunus trituberculatus TaxID=210409 RepID=A0A5B7CS56_PORTR|nr:hypothetical protein [Portunus trituberculatus]
MLTRESGERMEALNPHSSPTYSGHTAIPRTEYCPPTAQSPWTLTSFLSVHIIRPQWQNCKPRLVAVARQRRHDTLLIKPFSTRSQVIYVA